MQKQDNNCKAALLTYGGTSQGVKNRLFYGTYCHKAVYFNHCEFELGDSKKFQTWRPSKVGCWDISNLVTTKVAEFIEYKPYGGSNHLLSLINSKIE